LSVKIGNIQGIPIVLNYSWFIIFILIAVTVGYGLMPANYPGLSELAYLTIGISSSILLFASVLLHELAHSLVAKRNKLKIKRISLFLLGGVSEMEEEPQTPSLELKMAAAGPATSALLTVIVGLLWYGANLVHLPAIIEAPLQYTALINGIVTAFNLIPAFPMDGGRILRSIIWNRSKDMLDATRKAASAGRWIAYALIAVGIFIGFSTDFITGFWLILIGWMVSSGAQNSLAQTMIRQDLAGLRVSQVMTRAIDSVPPEMTLQQLHDEFLRLKHNGFPVMSGQDFVGCVTTDDLKKVHKDAWNSTPVSQVMVPRDKIVTIKPDEQVIKSISVMNDNRVGRLFVLDENGKLSGIITRSDVLKAIQAREGAQTSSSLGRTFSVGQGMYFVLEQQVPKGGKKWTASYSQEEMLLTGEKTDDEIQKFTFQALKVGTFKIRLSDSVRTIEYTVVVSQQ
jgi:Zn-dependent protease/CBS domain-containing protein